MAVPFLSAFRGTLAVLGLVFNALLSPARVYLLEPLFYAIVSTLLQYDALIPRHEEES